MKKLISISAIAAMIGLPLIAMAQTTPKIPTSVPTGTIVCRPAIAAEKANGSMGTILMMCRAVDVVRVNAALTRLNSYMAQRQAAAASTPDPDTQQMMQAATDVNAGFQPPVYPGSSERN
jgi:hypothetical protein